MDFHSDDVADLCSELEYPKSTALMKERKDLTTPHKPSDSMLDVHRMLFSRGTGRAEKHAEEALEVAWETLSDLKAQKPEAHAKLMRALQGDSVSTLLVPRGFYPYVLEHEHCVNNHLF